MSELKSESTSKQKLSKLVVETGLRIDVRIFPENISGRKMKSQGG
jgi:hypothetical protein